MWHWVLLGVLLGAPQGEAPRQPEKVTLRRGPALNVGVAEFRYQGPEAKAWLAVAVPEMLRQFLGRIRAFRVVDGLEWREAAKAQGVEAEAFEPADLQKIAQGENMYLEYVVRGEVVVQEGEENFLAKAQVLHLPSGKLWREHQATFGLRDLFGGLFRLMSALLDEWGVHLSLEDRNRLGSFVPTHSLLALEFYCQGLGLYNPDAPDIALQIWQRALEFDGQCAMVHAALGKAAYRRAQQLLQLAEESFQRTLAADAQNAEAHFALGVAHQAKGRHDMAEMEYLAALQSNPNHLEAHYNLGVLYLQARRRYNEAATQFQEVLRIAPRHVNAMNNLGVAYYHLGYRDRAIELWQAVLKLDPTNTFARENLERYSGF